ncbi:MAG: hypothetical protein IJ195_08020 [Lachnospiraceae bacterium]|nr:hypothetical protein [Lachnospiraceae bacterium]MBR1650310.1 hypothetical protein [Lachnospiraceae bacterium]
MAKKKLLCICVLAVAMICLTGCSDGSASTHNVSGTQSIAQVIQSEMDKEDAKAEEKNSDSSETTETSTGSLDDILASGDYPMSDEDGVGETELSPEKEEQDTTEAEGNKEENTASAGSTESGAIDIDLTVMGKDMVYAEVYNMMARPNDYIGKTIKMRGSYSYYYDSNSGNEYHACIIEDALACCSQGIEFVPTDAYTYPNDFPANGEEITVIGTFDIYLEADFAFMTLKNATLG